jgi:hypothetical protein
VSSDPVGRSMARRIIEHPFYFVKQDPPFQGRADAPDTDPSSSARTLHG